jgi:aryl-alcohol dehydrogenase-like predicted oxidoreductase
MIPWSPLAGGLLGGVLAASDGSGRGAGGRRGGPQVQDRIEGMRPQLAQWETFCAELGHPPADVALAWLLANPVVTAPIIGPRTVEQLDGAMGALDVQLDADALARLDEIFPGPGGPAPEAYAW